MHTPRAPTHRAFVSPFPPLELTSGDEARLEDMAYFLVQSSVAEYDNYVHKDRRVVDRDQWQFLKRKQHVRVYTERSERATAKRRRESMRLESARTEGSDFTGSFCCFERTWSSAADTSAGASSLTYNKSLNRSMNSCSRQARASLGLPAFLAAGSIEGSLDDVLYGVVSPTVDAMRITSAYVRDNVVDAAVLATIIAPTAEHPFRSLTVKWLERGPSSWLLSALAPRRHDAVLLESTGVTQLANGERVGYVLQHSVQFPETLERVGVVRNGVSVCMLFSAVTPTAVDVFVIGNVDQVRDRLQWPRRQPLGIKTAVERFVSVWRFVECARMKKLAWALQQQHACAIGDIAASRNSDGIPLDADGRSCNSYSSASDSQAIVRCTHCRRAALVTTLRFAPWRLWRRRAKRSVCALCCEYVCSSCLVTQTVSYVAPGANRHDDHGTDTSDNSHDSDCVLRQRTIVCCALCIHVAVQRTTTQLVASEEAAALARDSTGHKSLITAWLRGLLDVAPLCQYS